MKIIQPPMKVTKEMLKLKSNSPRKHTALQMLYPITGYIKRGQPISAPDGKRLFLFESEGDVFYLLLENSGVSTNRYYKQKASSFQREVADFYLNKTSKVIAPIPSLLEAEAEFLLGVASVIYVPAGVIIEGMEATKWIISNRERIKLWMNACVVWIEVRNELEKIAPTLQLKLEERFIEVLCKNLTDVHKKIFKDNIARTLGEIIGKFGKKELLKRLSIIAVLSMTIKLIADEIIKSVKSALGNAIVKNIDLRTKIILSFKQASIDLTDQEAKDIIIEIQKNQKKIRELMDRLSNSVQPIM